MMKKVASILSKRLGGPSKENMKELAEQSSEGKLSSFSAIFGPIQPNKAQETQIRNLLEKYHPNLKEYDCTPDLQALLSLTSEVKAITNQAAILHGERIKQAQTILKKYRDGAFTAWLYTTYGNRQTPYNFLQYYEFYRSLPESLHPQIESMPRQVIYTLASRKGPKEKKEEIIKNYQGETKKQLISLIRSLFPLEPRDKRKENIAANALSSMRNLVELFDKGAIELTKKQQKEFHRLISELKSKIAITPAKGK